MTPGDYHFRCADLTCGYIQLVHKESGGEVPALHALAQHMIDEHADDERAERIFERALTYRR